MNRKTYNEKKNKNWNVNNKDFDEWNWSLYFDELAIFWEENKEKA